MALSVTEKLKLKGFTVDPFDGSVVFGSAYYGELKYLNNMQQFLEYVFYFYRIRSFFFVVFFDEIMLVYRYTCIYVRVIITARALRIKETDVNVLKLNDLNLNGTQLGGPPDP